ncbi:hypothetical protein BCS42_01060 [Crenothrix sp. D3]|nr:hypothetical protein BCS42_01060 [Crenothrix sp. D3]
MAILIPATTAYLDTQFDDVFVAQSGVLTSTTFPGATFGIKDVTPVAGIATKVGTYGTLTLDTTTGAYTFTPNDAAIEPLAASVVGATGNFFSVFAVEAGGVPSPALPLGFDITVDPLATAGDTTGNDTILGTAGNDKVNSLAGNDSITGAGGIDSLSGGLGDDTYVLAAGNTGTVITEALDEGKDTVESSMTYTLAANVENLNLKAVGLVGTGNDLANKLTSTAGGNSLIGGAGNDTLISIVGIDSLAGGAGDDSYTVSNAATIITEVTGQGWDVETAEIADLTLASGVEVLILGGTVNAGLGNSVNNFLLGNAVANNLDGKGGADVMAAYAGDDNYTVDNIGDVVVENANEGYDSVVSTVSYTLAANVEQLDFRTGPTGALAFEATGNTLDNFIGGNEFNNVLNGGTGIDIMVGEDGNDAYFVDNIADVVREALVGNAGPNTSLNAGTADLVYSTAVSFDLNTGDASIAGGQGVENLVVWGTTGIAGIGNALNNIIYGQSLNNNLTGLDGADILVGGRGADTINLLENTASTDTVLIVAGDSTTTGFDIVNDFNVATLAAADNLNLDSTLIAANVTLNNGTDAGAIQTNSVANGIITFQGAGGVAINAANLVLADAIAYVQANIAGLQTVAFAQGTDTYVFQDGGANSLDTLVDLVGLTNDGSPITVTSIGTVAAVNGIWVI